MRGDSNPSRVFLSLCVLSMVFSGCSGENPGAHLRVMSFNVLCSFCDSSYPPWEQRLEYFRDIFERYDADLIGLQELTWPKEVEQILALKEGYKAVYFRGDQPGSFGLTDYPDATVLYNSDRFSVMESGNYWLSPTPDVAWSTGFADSAQFPRIVTWAIFEEISSGMEFLFVTTHFDNNSPSQELSAPLLLERTRIFSDKMPVIVTGDFNSRPRDPAYLELVAKPEQGGLGLVNTFDLASEQTLDGDGQNSSWEPGTRIDHIFLGGISLFRGCDKWTVDLHKYGQPPVFPSDHRVIEASVYLQW